ncbi:serine/threonine-protein kinase [Tahibacter caeni]|uniref:serine/threonine-protein kinase n=1 Tax=Tahibacter caeni TaxID=1453545 RepID=UPI0021478457|nr:serine/threonine-protein kinase [Tahibacter caeni]
MPDNTFQHLRRLFDELVVLTPAERIAALAGRDDLDERLRQRLVELLELDEEVGDLTARRAGTTASDAAATRRGMRIGAYVVDSPLGEGGMGSVYRAQRTGGDIDHVVAIKIARRDLLDNAALARFRVERQVLALLHHPHIATMYDVGELDDGTPYIVMEYVEGRPLLDYADRQQLGLRGRLELFLLLCDAVAYAHRNLIVHRDIKASNVLVTADGRPKLLDFGIAKPLQPRIGPIAIEQTRATQRYFSLRNAAPEQLRGEAIGVTCDVYGLGSVLYELLCGRPLYDFDGMTLADAEQRILEQDPPPPSQRVVRQAAPAWRRLPRELDAVALQALRREPDARYASVDALAQDVRRHLNGYPVSATPAPLLYRLSRFVRRHRIAVGTAALLAAVIVAGVTSWLQQYRSTLAERDRAETVTRTILRGLELTAPAGMRRKEVSAQALFREVYRLADLLSADEQRATRAQLVTTVARARHMLGNSDDALSMLGHLGSDTDRLPATLRNDVQLTRAEILLSVGGLREAGTLVRQNADRAGADVRWMLLAAQVSAALGEPARAIAALDRIAAQPDANREQRWEALRRRGVLLADAGNASEAVASQFLLLAEQEAHFKRGPSVEVLATLQNALQIAIETQAVGAALRLSQLAADQCRAIYHTSEEYACLIVADQRALVLAEAGRFDDAEQAARRTLALALHQAHGESELSAQLHFTLGEILRRRGANDAAAQLREAVRFGELFLGPGSIAVLRYRGALLVALLEQDDLFDARREALAGLRAMADRRFVETPEGELIRLADWLARQPRHSAQACSFETERWLAEAGKRRMDTGRCACSTAR